MINAVRIHEKDNVSTAITALKKGSKAAFLSPAGEEICTVLKEDIPIYHKYALVPIPKDAPIVKYGEHIGFAMVDIEEGQYVHIHNVYGKREDLRRRKGDSE